MLDIFLSIGEGGGYIIHTRHKIPKYPSAGRTVEESLQCSHFMGWAGDIHWF